MSATQSYCRFEEVNRDILLVVPRPELNDVQWADIEQIGDGIVKRIKSRARPKVVIDLGDLKYMGSAMVALLVRTWKAVDESRGRMAVCNVNGLVTEVLDLAGLREKWTFTSDRDSAIQSVGGSSSAASGSGSGGSSMLPAIGAIVSILIAVLGLLGVLGLVDLAPPVSLALLGLGGVAGIIFGVLAVASGGDLGKLIGGAAAAAAALVLVGGLVAMAYDKNGEIVIDDPSDPSEEQGFEGFEGDAEAGSLLDVPDDPEELGNPEEAGRSDDVGPGFPTGTAEEPLDTDAATSPE
ncbi:STAS domain-containing protein [Stratiformator vulcanicus]|uniref:STAS domain-containing protein n=1 Tax=Stratiformator vulcanicus TaxID=2527980 RepID=A0A517R3T1_9PLAN|nr:STAS domain-containing protein [Stratiformator vulcanicus]QDT38500.1 hypothetical protein Pan189_28940 [Stratiformator vulcanicus]